MLNLFTYSLFSVDIHSKNILLHENSNKKHVMLIKVNKIKLLRKHGVTFKFESICKVTLAIKKCINLNTAQKMKFSIKDFFSRKLQIWSHLLNKSSIENFIFCAVYESQNYVMYSVKNGLIHRRPWLIENHRKPIFWVNALRSLQSTRTGFRLSYFDYPFKRFYTFHTFKTIWQNFPNLNS